MASVSATQETAACWDELRFVRRPSGVIVLPAFRFEELAIWRADLALNVFGQALGPYIGGNRTSNMVTPGTG